MQETWIRSLSQEDPLEKEMATHPKYSCLENPHGQRSLAGYSPWGHNESDMTEQLSTAQSEKLRYIFFLDLCVLILLNFLGNRKFCH